MYDHWIEDEDEEVKGIKEKIIDSGNCKELMYKHLLQHV
jgi:hypothetical protein